jgi:hypothetical protein
VKRPSTYHMPVDQYYDRLETYDQRGGLMSPWTQKFLCLTYIKPRAEAGRLRKRMQAATWELYN